MSALPYRDPAPSPTLIRLLGFLNRHLVLPHIARVTRVHMPDVDAARLRRAVHRDTAAFLAPSHPEFMTDWMIDKELSHRHSPLMASWAAADIVNASPLAQRFWLANGLIANVPGAGGKAYSARVAREGHGVLLHPEGLVNWQAERVGRLHRGVIDMAVSLARAFDAEGTARPVHVVPMVWRFTFTHDASRGLVREMQLIERECGLSVPASTDPAERLASLLSALLIERARALGLARPNLDADRSGPEYFAAQSQVMADIRARLTETYGDISDDPMQALRTVNRALRRQSGADASASDRDRALVTEMRRLARLDAALYGRETITQEQIAEILKSTRTLLVTRGLFNKVHNLIPRGVAPRVAHVRVADPIDVRDAVAAGVDNETLLTTLHTRMQLTLDGLGADLEGTVGPRRAPNPLSVPGGNGYERRTAEWAWNNRAS